MTDYKSLVKNIFLLVFIVQIIKLYIEKNELSSINAKALKKQRKLSEILVEKKTKQIDSLKTTIIHNEYLIDSAFSAINDLQSQKNKVKKVYIERIKEINTLDANELKNYFNEELK
jgi:hypothetical protein